MVEKKYTQEIFLPFPHANKGNFHLERKKTMNTCWNKYLLDAGKKVKFNAENFFSTLMDFFNVIR